MKKLVLFAAFLIAGLSTAASAQYYSNSNTTYKYSYPTKGYSTTQSYTSPKGYSTVKTQRSYNSSGGYTSSTTSYGSKGLKSRSTTTYTPGSGYRTVKYNYQTGKTTYKYSTGGKRR